MTQIIQFAGPGGVGKSTTAQHLRIILGDIGIKALVASYAGPLYEVTARITGVHEGMMRANKEKPIDPSWTAVASVHGVTPRQCLQRVGESMRALFGPNIWVDRMRETVAFAEKENCDWVIIDDARHDSEFALGNVVELTRSGVDYARNHASAMPPDPKFVWHRINIGKDAPVRVAHRVLVHMDMQGLISWK